MSNPTANKIHESLAKSRPRNPRTGTPIDQTGLKAPIRAGVAGYDELNKYDKGLMLGMDQQANRAGNQSAFDKWTGFIINSAAEVVGGTIEGAGYLLDFEQHKNMLNGTEQEFGNWFSDLGVGLKDMAREGAPIYQAAPGTWNPGDVGWWADNGVSMASTLSLLIPSSAAVRATSAIGKLARAKQVVDGARKLTKTQQALKGIEAATYSRMMENTMESSQIFDSIFEQKIQEGKTDQEAKQIAGEAASKAWLANSINLVFDIPQYIGVMRGMKGWGKMAKDAKKLTPKQRALELGKTMIGEGFEESFQFMVGEEAHVDADGGEFFGEGFTERLTSDYLKSGEMWTAAFFGALGGGAFAWLGPKLNKVIQNKFKNEQGAMNAGEVGDPVAYNALTRRGLAQAAYKHVQDGTLDSMREELSQLENMPEDLEANQLLDFIEQSHTNYKKDGLKDDAIAKAIEKDVDNYIAQQSQKEADALMKKSQEFDATELTTEQNLYRENKALQKAANKLYEKIGNSEKLTDKQRETAQNFLVGRKAKLQKEMSELSEKSKADPEMIIKPPKMANDNMYENAIYAKLREEALVETMKAKPTKEELEAENQEKIDTFTDMILDSAEGSKEDILAKLDNPPSNLLILDDLKKIKADLSKKYDERLAEESKDAPSFDIDNPSLRYEGRPLLKAKEMSEFGVGSPEEMANLMKQEQAGVTADTLEAEKFPTPLTDAVTAQKEAKETAKEIDETVEQPTGEQEIVEYNPTSDPSPVIGEDELLDGKEENPFILQTNDGVTYSTSMDGRIKIHGIGLKDLNKILTERGYQALQKLEMTVATFKKRFKFSKGVNKAYMALKTKNNEHIFTSFNDIGVDFDFIRDPKNNFNDVVFEVNSQDIYEDTWDNLKILLVHYIDGDSSNHNPKNRKVIGMLKGHKAYAFYGQNAEKFIQLRKNLYATFTASNKSGLVNVGSTVITDKYSGRIWNTPTVNNPDDILASGEELILGVGVQKGAETVLQSNEAEIEFYDRSKITPGAVYQVVDMSNGTKVLTRLFTKKLKDMPKLKQKVLDLLASVTPENWSDVRNEIRDIVKFRDEKGNAGPDFRGNFNDITSPQAYYDSLNLDERIVQVDYKKVNTENYNKNVANDRLETDVHPIIHSHSPSFVIEPKLTETAKPEIFIVGNEDMGYDVMHREDGLITDGQGSHTKAEAEAIKVNASMSSKKSLPIFKTINDTRNAKLDAIKPDGKTSKERKKIIAKSRLNDNTQEETLAEAGYIEVDGLWIDPNSDMDILKSLDSGLWGIMKEEGILIISFDKDGIHHGMSGTVTFKEGASGEIQLTPKTKDSHAVLHEIGHFVYSQMTNEEKSNFDNYEKAVTAYVKNLEQGKLTSGASNAEENFVENWALDTANRTGIKSKGYEGVPIQDLYKKFFDKINSKYGKTKERPRFSRPGKRAKFKLQDTNPKWNKEEELAWFKKVLPNVPVHVLEDLVSIAKGGAKAWGMFYNASVYLNENASEGTAYHEAFHAVFNLYLNDQEQKQVLESHLGKDWSNVYSSLEAEEQLAYAFEAYKLTKSNRNLTQKVVDFFKRLLATIQTFVTGKQTIDTLFYNIDKGKFANNKIVRDVSNMSPKYKISGFSPQMQRDRVNSALTMLDQAIDRLREQAPDLSLKQIYREALSNNLNDNLITSRDKASVYTYIQDQYQTLVEQDKMTPEIERKFQDFLDGIVFEQDGEIVAGPLYEHIVRGLASRGVIAHFNKDTTKANVEVANLDPKDLNENEDLFEILESEVRQDSWAIKSLQVSPKENLTTRLKRWLASLPEVKYSNEELVYQFDDLGFEKFLNPDRAYAQLQSAIGNSISSQHMIDKLEEMSAINATFSVVLEDVIENPDLETQLFVHIAQKIHASYRTVVLSSEVNEEFGIKENRARLIKTNRSDLQMTLLGDLYDSYKQRKVTPELIAKYREGVEKIRQSYKDAESKEAFKLGAIRLDGLRKVLKLAGLDIDKDALKALNNNQSLLYLLGIKGQGISLNTYFSALEENIDPFNSDKYSGNMRRLAGRISAGYTTNYQSAHKNVEGKKIYEWINSSYIGRLVNQLKSGDIDNMVASYSNDPFYKTSPLLKQLKNKSFRDKINFVIFDGLKRQGQDTGITYDNMSDIDIYTMLINGYHNNGASTGVFNLPILADAPVLAGIEMPKYNNLRSGENNIVDQLYQVALQEYARIQDYKKSKDGIKGRQAEEYVLMPFLKGVDVTNKTETRNAILKWLTQQVTNEIDNLIELNALKRLDDGTLVKGEVPLFDIGVMDNLEEFMVRFVANYTLVQSQIITLTTGDPAYYKGVGDFFKRAKEIWSPGTYLDTEAHYQLGDKRIGVRKEYNVGIIADIEIVSPQQAEIKSNLIKVGLSEEVAKSISDQYDDVSVTDAQSYVDIFRYREQEIGLNRWTPSRQAAYEKMIKGEEVNNEIFQPVKPFYFGHRYVNSRVVPTQNKDSEYLLTPSMAKGNPKLQAILEKMGYTFYSKAIKAKHRIPMKFGDGTGGRAMRPEFKGKSTLDLILSGDRTATSRDISKSYNKYNISKGDIIEFYDGKGNTALVEVTVEPYNVSEVSSDQWSKLEGWSSSVYERLSDSYQQFRFKRHKSSDFTSVELDEAGRFAGKYMDKLTFDTSIKVGKYNVADSVDELDTYHQFSNSHWRLQQETPEHHIDTDNIFGTQVMKLITEGVESDNIYIVNGKKVKGSDLKQTYNDILIEDIKAKYEEIDSKVSNFEELVELIEAEVIRRNLGSNYLDALRIITTDETANSKDTALPLYHPLHSYTVEAILNSVYRKGVTRQRVSTGGSFINVSPYGLERQPKIVFKEDGGIDYMEAYISAWDSDFMNYVDDAGNIDIKAIEAVDPNLLKGILYRIPTEDKYSMFNIKVIGFLPNHSGGGVILPPEATKIAGLDFDIDKVFGYFYTKGKDSKISRNLTTKAGRDNVKLDNMLAVLQSPHSLESILNPGGFERLKKTNKAIIKAQNLDEGNLSLLTPSTTVTIAKRMNAGKSLIGVAATNNAVHSLWQNYQIELKDGYTFKFNGNTYRNLSAIYEPGTKNSIARNIAENLAAFVDNGKDPQAEYFNMNLFTAPVGMAMLHAGIPLETVQNFLAQPSIRKYTKDYFNLGGTSQAERKAQSINNVKPPSPLDGTKYVGNLSDKVLKAGLKNLADSPRQRGILEIFLAYKMVSGSVSSLVSATRVSDTGPGPTMANTMSKIRIRNKDVGTVIQGNLMMFRDNNYNNAFYEYGVKRAMDDIAKYSGLPNLNKGEMGYLIGELEWTYKGSPLSAAEIEFAYRSYIDYLTSDPHEDMQSLVEKMPNRLRQLKQTTSDYAPFTERLHIVTENEKEYVKFVGITGTDPIEKDNIRNAWASMMNDPSTRGIAHDLVKYTRYMSGFRITPNSFSQLIPTYYYTSTPEGMEFNKMVRQKMGNLTDNTDRDRAHIFLDQFSRNHFENINYIPSVQNSEAYSNITSITDDYIVIDPTSEDFIVRREAEDIYRSPYIKFEGEIYKYSPHNELVYTKQQILGVKNRFVEFSINNPDIKSHFNVMPKSVVPKVLPATKEAGSKLPEERKDGLNIEKNKCDD